MSEYLPIRSEELLLLTTLGIPETLIGFYTVTMGSDKFICVRHEIDTVPHVWIIDLESRKVLTKRRTSAESAILNDSGKLIALRSKALSAKQSTLLQVASLETRNVLRSHVFPENVEFWKWISSDTIGFATWKSVYHWVVEDNSNPVKIFDRHPDLSLCLIVNYQVDERRIWAVLAGISQDAGAPSGDLQLYSVERKISQLIKGFAPCFALLKVECNPQPRILFCFVTKGLQNYILYMSEVGSLSENNQSPHKKKVNFSVTEEEYDFPVSLQSCSKYGILYIFTKCGFFYLYDLESAACMYFTRLCYDPIFLTVRNDLSDGIIAVNKKGRVLSVSINVSCIIQYLCKIVKNPCLATRFASRNNLRDSDDSFITLFNELFESSLYSDAAKIAANAPGGILRTPETLGKLLNAKQPQGAVSPTAEYFGEVLQNGCLNKFESMEIIHAFLSHGKVDAFKKLLEMGKIECTEELGDIVSDFDLRFGLSVYLRASAHCKVVLSFAKLGEFENLVHYSVKVSYKPDYYSLLDTVLSLNPVKGVEFAKILYQYFSLDIDLHLIVKVFMGRNLLKQCTELLLNTLVDNKPCEGALQTKVLEINLNYGAPLVADAILVSKMFSHYDKNVIAHLCEKACLMQRALENFTDLEDISRVIVRIPYFDPDWLVDYFGTLSVDDALHCLNAILSSEGDGNLSVCLRVVLRYYKELTISAVVDLFENFHSRDAIFHFLKHTLFDCKDPSIHFKYIQIACEMGQMSEVERVCRESEFYSPEEVKNYLKCSNLPDYLALLIVCDRFNYTQELVLFLFSKKLHNYINTFVGKVNPAKLPEVVSELFNLDASDTFISDLISSVSGTFSTEALLAAAEERNKLSALRGWLESKKAEGSTEPCVHNALCKIYIDNNWNPEIFLKGNCFYDGRIIGKYCEHRNPGLASIAYLKGNCKLELIILYKENALYKQAARYLVSQKDKELWHKVLSEDSIFRNKVIDQVTSFVLKEVQKSEEVCVVVTSLIEAGLYLQTIQLLEKLILVNERYAKESKLQNLLILTAMKVEPDRVLNFVKTLNDYTPEVIAGFAVEMGFLEEALVVYTKFNLRQYAVKILVNNMNDLERAKTFAQECGDVGVWEILGKAQLDRDLVKDAIASFINAKNISDCQRIVESAHKNGMWQLLVNYLEMAVKIMRDTVHESELAFAYAKCNFFGPLEEFISSPNNVDMTRVGDRCFEDDMFLAAELLYKNACNYPKLALTQIKLNNFAGAVASARKANLLDVWKKVCFSCIEQKIFFSAETCAHQIVTDVEGLDELVDFYVQRNYIEEIIHILEIGITNKHTHIGMFTHLSIFYAKYKQEKLMSHLELFWSRINVSKVIESAEEAQLWKEVVYLHDKYENYESVVSLIMEHPTETWREGYFKEMASRISNHKLHLDCINFYLVNKPHLLNDFLMALSNKLDYSKVITFLSASGHLASVKDYMYSIQHLNNKIINESLNDLLIEEEDFEGLMRSVNLYDNFDFLSLTRRLATHDLMEFRRIAVMVLKKNKSWFKSLDLCKVNGLYSDAILIAVDSVEKEVAHHLLEWFLIRGKTDCFVACLLQCHNLLLPSEVLDLMWRHYQKELSIPYLVHALRSFTRRVDHLSSIKQGENA